MNKLKSEVFYYPMTGDEIIRQATHARVMCQKFNQLPADDYAAQTALIREFFGSTGENVSVMQNFRCALGFNIHVGEDFFANYNCTIIDVAPVVIGDNCQMAPNVAIYTAGHPVHPAARNTAYEYGISVTIGNNVWIGGNSVILPGVNIGDNTVIGAGSVVTRDIPSGVADVIVCEAFVGNVILKMYEGVGTALIRKVKSGMMNTFRSKIGALLVKPALKKTLKSFDATEYGGAPLLGLNGLVVKTHGSSTAKEVKNTIAQCITFKEQDIVNKMKACFTADKA